MWHGRSIANHQVVKAILYWVFALSPTVWCHDDVTTSDGYVGDCRLLTLSTPGVSFELTNPNYPRMHFVRGLCWVIHISQQFYQKYRIQLTVNDLDLHVPGVCAEFSDDFIETRDGRSISSQLIRRWCRGWTTSVPMDSIACGPDLFFRSKVSRHSISHRGFNVSYMAVSRDMIQCAHRPRKGHSRFTTGAIAGIIVIVILLVVMFVVIAFVFYWRKSEPAPTNQAFWQPDFQHCRFSNDEMGADDGLPPQQLHRPPSRSASVQLSESMRNISQPLPIGIPQAYKTDGFPSSYAANYMVGNPSAAHDGEPYSASAPASVATTATVSSSASTQASTGLEDVGIAIVGGATPADVGLHSIQNPLYEMSLQESGLPVEPPSGVPVDQTADPLCASTLLESSNSSAVLSLAKQELSMGSPSESGGDLNVEKDLSNSQGFSPSGEDSSVTDESQTATLNESRA